MGLLLSSAASEMEAGMTGCIVGWAHTKFGKHEGRDVESLIVEVAQGALADAGVAAADIDQVFLGTMNGGFVKQEFPASLVFQADPAFRFKPATRVENACATGSAAIHMGLNTIAAGKARLVLVVGVEKMTEASGAEVNDLLLRASLPQGGGPDRGRFRRHLRPDRAEIFPALRRPVGRVGPHRRQEPQERRLEPAGADAARPRLRVLPQCLRQEPARRRPPEAHRLLAGVGRCGGGGAGRSADRAGDEEGGGVPRRRAGQRFSADEPARHPRLRGAGTGLEEGVGRLAARLDDLDLVETHDCFTIAELIEYEAMGLTPKGEGARAILEGWTEKDGRLPINPSGGLKSKGHPVGATGVSMHVLASMQVTGQAGDMQIPNARARRHHEHGRRRGRQFRQHPRTAARLTMADCGRQAAPNSPASEGATQRSPPPALQRRERWRARKKG